MLDWQFGWMKNSFYWFNPKRLCHLCWWALSVWNFCCQFWEVALNCFFDFFPSIALFSLSGMTVIWLLGPLDGSSNVLFIPLSFPAFQAISSILSSRPPVEIFTSASIGLIVKSTFSSLNVHFYVASCCSFSCTASHYFSENSNNLLLSFFPPVWSVPPICLLKRGAPKIWLQLWADKWGAYHLWRQTRGGRHVGYFPRRCTFRTRGAAGMWVGTLEGSIGWSNWNVLGVPPPREYLQILSLGWVWVLQGASALLPACWKLEERLASQHPMWLFT